MRCLEQDGRKDLDASVLCRARVCKRGKKDRDKRGGEKERGGVVGKISFRCQAAYLLLLQCCGSLFFSFSQASLTGDGICMDMRCSEFDSKVQGAKRGLQERELS